MNYPELGPGGFRIRGASRAFGTLAVAVTIAAVVNLATYVFNDPWFIR